MSKKLMDIRLRLKDAYAVKHALDARVENRKVRVRAEAYGSLEEHDQLVKDIEHETQLLTSLTAIIEDFEARINRPRPISEEVTKKCGTCAWPTGNICLNFAGEEGKKAAVGRISPACSNYLEDTLNPAYKAALEPIDEDDHGGALLDPVYVTWDQYFIDVRRTTPQLGSWDLVTFAAMGIATEAGETLDVVRKHQYQGHPFSKENVVDELGDLFFFITMLLDQLDVSPADVLAANVKKRQERYPQGFDPNRSINK